MHAGSAESFQAALNLRRKTSLCSQLNSKDADKMC